MPTYEITAPNGKTYRIDGPEGATDEQVRAQVLKQFPDAARRSPSPQPRTTMQELGRQAQLTGRHAVEGLAGIAGLVTNPLNAAIDATFGTNIGSDLQGAAGDTLTRAGVAEPETGLERVVGDASRAVVGASPFVKGGQLLAQGAGTLNRLIGQALAANPVSQVGYAAAGGASSGAMREAGGGQLAQMVAGVAAPSLATVAGRFATGAVSPLFKSGQRAIASRTYADQATNPQNAIRSLRDFVPDVDGSVPTTAAAARDTGLLGFEKGVRARNPVPFAEQASNNNAARQQALSRVARTPETVEHAKLKRDRVTAPLREQAFGGGGRAFVDDVITGIDEQLASPVGKREQVAQTLKWAREKIAGETDARNLYEIRKDLMDAMTGKLDKDGAKYSLARKELGAVVQTLDDAIEQAAPGFKKYLARYRAMSKPIDQMERLQRIQKGAELSLPDPATGLDQLSQAKFSRLADAELADPKSPLTGGQKRVLKNVMADLDKGSAMNTNTLRAPGSDTFQNYSLANIVGHTFMGRSGVPTWMSPLARPFAWIYKWSDEAVQELLVEAAKDPEIGEMLLRKATPQNAKAVGNMMAERWGQQLLPATQGASQAEQSPPDQR